MTIEDLLKMHNTKVDHLLNTQIGERNGIITVEASIRCNTDIDEIYRRGIMVTEITITIQ